MLGISYAALIVAHCFGDWRDGCGRVLVAVSLLQIMIIALQIGAMVAAIVLSRPVPIVTRKHWCGGRQQCSAHQAAQNKVFQCVFIDPSRSVRLSHLSELGFRSCDRRKARGANLPQRSRRVCASEQTSIIGAAKGC